LRQRKKHSPSTQSIAAAAHLDNLLDEALRETFPASDPVAITIEITIDKPSESVAPPEELNSADNPSTAAESQEVAVVWGPPVFGLFDENLWALASDLVLFRLVDPPAWRSKTA
jgi:hypothetical protein